MPIDLPAVSDRSGRALGVCMPEEAFDRDLETERVEAMAPLIKGSDSGNQFLCGKVRNS
jgi:hypothetical protein